MKKLFLLTFLAIASFCTFSYSQEIPEGAIKLDENTVIKDESGTRITIDEFMKLMDTGEWSINPVKETDGSMYLQLKKATEEEKKMMSEMRANGPQNFPGSENYPKGTPAVHFSFTDSKGNVISTESTKGKTVVLNFWFTACKPCIAEMPELNAVYEKYKSDPNVVFAAVTFDTKKQVKSFLKKHDLKWSIVTDEKTTCDAFSINGFPTTLVIDKNGNYISYLPGIPGIEGMLIQAIQEALLGNIPVEGE